MEKSLIDPHWELFVLMYNLHKTKESDGMNLYNHKIEVSCDTCGKKITVLNVHIDSNVDTSVKVPPHQCKTL
jgi:hypothetical protein